MPTDPTMKRQIAVDISYITKINKKINAINEYIFDVYLLKN